MVLHMPISKRDVLAVWSRRQAGNRLVVTLNPTSARLWLRPRGMAWGAVPKAMVEYIDPYLNFKGLACRSQVLIAMSKGVSPAKMSGMTLREKKCPFISV
jgi:hypothetical protein